MMRVLLLGLALLTVLPSDSKVAAAPNLLVGSWKLVSAQTATQDGRVQNSMGEYPKGYMILTPEGRMMTISTTNNRKVIPETDADTAELWKTMNAYTGTYRIEGDDIIVKIDVAWYELWTGSEQRRHYKLEGDKLTFVTAPHRVGAGPQKDLVITSTIVWQREK